MDKLQAILRESHTSGMLRLGGEMDIPANQGCLVGYRKAVEIAEACGYLVQRQSSTHFQVSGPGLDGYYECDWFHPDNQTVRRLAHWQEQVAYMSDVAPEFLKVGTDG